MRIGDKPENEGRKKSFYLALRTSNFTYDFILILILTWPLVAQLLFSKIIFNSVR